MPKVTFNRSEAAFYSECKNAVDRYFADAGLKRTGDWRLHLKTIVLGSSAVVLYCLLLALQWPAIVGILLSATLGLVLASIGFNVMHDACHGSYSSRKWINNVLGLSLNALGGNAFIWKFKHNIIHHTYTNVDGVDDDIAKSPIMRQCPTQKWVPAHRFQHFYVVAIYAISSFAWIFIMDFTKYFSKRVFKTPLQKMNGNEHFVFWLSKALYLLFYIALPVFFVGWGKWAVGFACMHVVMGLCLALVFQLAHVVEHVEFESAGVEPKHIENEWAIHQVRTTSNFAPHNLIVRWFTGGLNYQVEHHLFPRVSHIHYPRISNIIAASCQRHNLPYHVNPTMTGAVSSHFRMMKALGKKPADHLLKNLQLSDSQMV